MESIYPDIDKNVPRTIDAKRITVNGISYDRISIKSRMIDFGENLYSVIAENVNPFYKEGDWLALSQKLVAVCNKNVRHISTIKVSLLARIFVLGVTKHKDESGWSVPAKVQVAIDEVGVLKIVPAMIIGAIGKIFGIRGLFWRIAGNHVAEIDGLLPESMYPYTEYAILPPPNPQQICDNLQKKTAIKVVLLDANFRGVNVLGISSNVGLPKSVVRKILLDNPLGQGNRMTPFVIVRKVS